MNVSCEVRHGTGLVRIAGPLTSGTVEEFRRVFWSWFPQSGCRRVVLDLAAMEALDSTGLGALVGALKLVAEKAGDICVAALQKRPRLVFEITRSYKVFEIFDTVEEALAAAR